MSQINFLPWAKLDRHLRVGPTKVVPWSAAREQLAPDVRGFIDRCFARYVTNDGNAMSDIAIAYLGDDPTSDLSDTERLVLRRSVDVLTFVALTEQLRTAVQSDYGGFGLSNSERFHLVTQRLGTLDDYVTVVSGGMEQTWGIDDVHFCIPWFVGSDFYRLDEDIVLPLSVLAHEDTPFGARFGRALEWFRLAHTGSDDTSELSRVVMMSTAYEILFNPGDEKRKAICSAIDRLTSRRRVARLTVRIGGQPVDLAAPAAWFDTFYRLRNKIVHGDPIPSDDLVFTGAKRRLLHRMVAALVLWEIAMWYLFERGELAQGSYQLAKRFSPFEGQAEPEAEFVRNVASGSLGISSVHKALGWTSNE